MHPNLSTSYAAIQTERNRLSAQAEQGWRVAEATHVTEHRSFIATLRHHAGGILVGIGERLQNATPGMPTSRVIDAAGN